MAAPLFPEADVLASRRSFFKRAGAGAAALALVATGCDTTDPMTDGDVTLDFSMDTGVLNYAYALEQLEAAFYAAVVGDAAFTTTFSSAAERQLLLDIAAHEAIHRDFLAAALGSAAVEVTPVLTAVNLTSRTAVLQTARTFEDLGVAAYNGAGKYLQDAGLLLVAGKIVSVEARHASAIRDLLLASVRSGATVGEAGGGLPEVVVANSLDVSLEPEAVLAAAGAFFAESFAVTGT